MRLLNVPLTEKNVFVYIFATNFDPIRLKNFFSKLVKVLVLELFYGTRTRVHFSISALVLEVFCGTRTRKLSTRLHHWYQRWRSGGRAPSRRWVWGSGGKAPSRWAIFVSFWKKSYLNPIGSHLARVQSHFKELDF